MIRVNCTITEMEDGSVQLSRKVSKVTSVYTATAKEVEVLKNEFGLSSVGHEKIKVITEKKNKE